MSVTLEVELPRSRSGLECVAQGTERETLGRPGTWKAEPPGVAAGPAGDDCWLPTPVKKEGQFGKLVSDGRSHLFLLLMFDRKQ